ncbi:unnamed protein product [Rotaria socialis]|uniref:THO1-MOS11 C-terminal domain-containing protein n=1 Tax=Rotaria socialis TaxID=392032 RepID=A0A817TAF6_9BILA|nr:unnamed protein product [Rotaria socialis]CAF4647068.1 unnamed protein product [Rotaria socialis]
MATNKIPEVKSPVEKTKELAEALTEFELNHGVISADNQTKEVSAVDKFKHRLERFGKISPEAKQISRALRFGTSHEAIEGTAKKRRLERFGVVPNSEKDTQQKKRQRADRFHLTNTKSTVDEDTKRKRIDRFGLVTSLTTATTGKSPSTTSTVPDAIKKRAERFGDISQVAKTNTINEQKLKRIERFTPKPNT